MTVRRSLLFSMMLIGAVVALATGATTFAPFTDSDTASSPGGVTAGEVALNLKGNPDESITFTGNCTSEVAPGDVCSESLAIMNATGGNGLAVTYTLETWADSDGIDSGASGSGGDTVVDCINVEYDADAVAEGTVANQSTTGAVAGGSGPDADTDDLDPAEEESFLLEVAVDDDDSCQSASATVMGIAIATQSATPHD